MVTRDAEEHPAFGVAAAFSEGRNALRNLAHHTFAPGTKSAP
jgi:hypothetical protein